MASPKPHLNSENVSIIIYIRNNVYRSWHKIVEKVGRACRDSQVIDKTQRMFQNFAA